MMMYDLGGKKNIFKLSPPPSKVHTIPKSLNDSFPSLYRISPKIAQKILNGGGDASFTPLRVIPCRQELILVTSDPERRQSYSS